MTVVFRDVFLGRDGRQKKGRRKQQPFLAWIRSEPRLDSIVERLSVIDCDIWIHQYRAHRDCIGERMIDSIMLVELKTFGAEPAWSQRDTLKLIGACHRKKFYDKRGKVLTTRVAVPEVRLVRNYGPFLLQLSKDRPDISDRIIWHGRQIDLNMLVDVLSFKRSPRTLNLRSERRHHLASARQRQPELNLVVTA
jgi:hypothetical protein